MFRSLNIESLRKAASSVFSKPNFHNVRWAGVFGLFAVGSQTKSSNVDVIVILMPHCEQINSHPLSLEDELFRVWGRKPRIRYIRKGEFWHLTSVQALLCSRTLAGSDQDDEVVRLRNEARNILDSGLAKFTAVLDIVQWTRSLVEGITIEEFLTSPQLQCSVRDNIQSILDDLDIRPRYPVIYEGYRASLISYSEGIQLQINDRETSNTNDLGPDYWEFIWNIVTDELDGLENLDWRIQELVILDIRETWELSDFVRKLEMEDEANGSDVLKGLTMCRCCIL
ncbi:hypothetical protein V8E54_008188 [Elaphomyces granulatus]